MLYARGVATGRISLERFAEITATEPAKIFGMWPAKGTIAIGSDADVVVIDPAADVTITDEMSHSRSDVEAYRGSRAVGWPITTISRGQVIVTDGRFLGVKGRGRFVTRQPTSPVANRNIAMGFPRPGGGAACSYSARRPGYVALRR